MKRWLRFTLQLLVILLLFAVVFSYAMFQGGFVSWFLFTAFLPFILYMLLLLVYPLDNWAATRHLSKRIVQAGDSVEVEVLLTRRTPFPLFYCVLEEYFPASLKKRDTHIDKFRWMSKTQELMDERVMKRVAFPWFQRSIRYRYTLDHIPRGEHHLKSIRIKTGDFFGFIKKEHVFESAHMLIAYPYRRDLQFKEQAYSYQQGASPSLSLSNKNTNIVAGVREYMPGDRFQWIDWKATARKDAIMTKEFEQEKSVDMLVVLDAGRRASQNMIAFEGAVELTDSLLAVLQKKSSQLLVKTMADRTATFSFQQNKVQMENIRRHLSTVMPIGQASFSKRLAKEQHQLPAGVITMLVTTTLDDELVDALARMQHKAKRVVLFFISPSTEITAHTRKLMKQLDHRAVIVNLLTEDELSRKKFEVKV
ncbi:DUF58 domain-containing protein [Thalassobacillus devorans]|uniref:DUF58 domain-containing protein n=1 Tax=Thalassobacillus devorans TaxID=279813 RepID=UPI00048F248C|nr:DUF58 domain-containing protein [Thalassobacillus devorans]